MTTSAPRTPTPPKPLPAEAGPPSTASAIAGIALRLSRPNSTSIVVHIAGELDATTTPRLHELLAPRLSSTAETLILDLSGLRFLGVTGLELLAHTRRRAASRALRLCLVDGPVCVDRALHAAGWSDTIPTYATVETAITELAERPHEHPERAR